MLPRRSNQPSPAGRNAIIIPKRSAAAISNGQRLWFVGLPLSARNTRVNTIAGKELPTTSAVGIPLMPMIHDKITETLANNGQVSQWKLVDSYS
jgi:hypothetical protein